MKPTIIATLTLLASTFAHAGDWQPLFDGKTLEGWDGNPKFWTVKDGAITGTTTEANPTDGNTFIIFTGENKDKTPVEFSDFELKFEYRIEGHNSGMQYRSFKLEGDNDGWRVGGYQADFDAKKQWAGTNYGEKFRGILAKRGEKAVITGTNSVQTKRGVRVTATTEVEPIGDPGKLAEKIKDAPAWNEMHIIAKGNDLQQKINGVLMSHIIDNDKENARDSGLIALQLHGGPPMVVQIRNVQNKELD
ncbi:MAG: DUF1080 domain-containing protein [Verrucomicrobiota bacterium]